MRKAFDPQGRFDSPSIVEIRLNLECRDEVVPILRSLQYVYSQEELRDQILALVAADVNKESDATQGRPGLSYWKICVLAAVRRGCKLNLDKLQNLAERHLDLRHIMGIGDWEDPRFDWRLIRDTLCMLQPATVDKISLLVCQAGQRLVPDAPEKVRADSFVVETNIHYPTESSIIRDAVAKAIPIAVLLSDALNLDGWRQHHHLLARVKELSREIDRICGRKGPNYKERSKRPYRKLIRIALSIAKRCREAINAAEGRVTVELACLASELAAYVGYMERVCNVASRRVLRGEEIPNKDKLFSIYEPHTQLYKRGKAGEPVQFGRLVLVYEDAAGFIFHHHVMPRDKQDADVVVEETQVAQDKVGGKIKELSLDCGFHTPDNQIELAKIVPGVCLPKPGPKQAARQNENASEEFRQARQRHPGVESAIGSLQSGNGLKRCVDRTERGFERYVALAVLGRNLHVLGKLLIAREAPESESAYSARKSAAA